jgi:periplasmic protein TonB
MASHPDILDEREKFSSAVLRSFGLHAGMAALIIAWSFYESRAGQERWGDPNSLGGGSVGITPVARIPLPSREGRINPGANDTESQVPSPPKPEPKEKAPVPDPAAIALKSKNAQKKPSPREMSKQQYNPLRDPRQNQTYSSTGQAATSPMFSQAPGGGGVGSGSSSPFGNRFGWYEQLLRETVARNWRSQELDARITNRVAVTFEILRNGTIRNVRITQPSGNFSMDQTAQRAVLMSNPLPALPREFERDTATVEFWFGLQK